VISMRNESSLVIAVAEGYVAPDFAAAEVPTSEAKRE
jgi:hypothetical protein